jgi:cysteine desulfurase/selenocysteine lyase
MSNVLGTVNDVAEIIRQAHAAGAITLIDGCQAIVHQAVDVKALDADFYVFSGHKLYGPTGIGVLWGRYDLLDAMPPYQGGGSMIDRVTFAKTTYAPAPGRFEAGTPHIVGVIGLHAAIDYVEGVGLERIHAHETALVTAARERLSRINSVRLFGPEDSAGIVSFAVEGVHPHDVATILDESKVAIRAGHHCAQPLMEALGVPATARASFGVYSSMADVEALGEAVERVTRIFG